MRIVLFRNGEMGKLAALPGEDPLVELSDLLGGEIDFTPTLYRRMQVVHLRYGEKLELPCRYEATVRKTFGLGDDTVKIFGDCAVVVRLENGAIRDTKKDDCLAANLVIRGVET